MNQKNKTLAQHAQLTAVADMKQALDMFFRSMRTARAVGLDKKTAALSANQFVRLITHIDLKAELIQAYQEAMREHATQNIGGNVLHFPKS